MIFRTMRPGEEQTWANHCATVFQGPTDTPEFFLNHYMNDPYHEVEGVFIAEDDGKISAAVHVFKREIYLGGRRVGMGGIADVSTLEAYRRQGLSGKLLEMAVDYMNANDMPTSMLFTGTNHHYARYGWFTHVLRRVRVPLTEDLPAGTHAAPLTDAHISIAAGLNAFTAPRFNLTMVREHPSYDAWVKNQIKNPIGLFRGDTLLAYIDYSAEENAPVSLTDYAALPEGDFYMPLLSDAARRTGAKMEALIPSALAAEKSGPFKEDTSMMLRLNKPFYIGDNYIDTPGKLASAAEDGAFFQTDTF